MKPGKAIRLVRGARGITQKELAHRASLDASYVSLVERDMREPSLKTLEAIATALDAPLYLLVLLGSDPSELKGVSESQAQALGRELLRVLVEGTR